MICYGMHQKTLPSALTFWFLKLKLTSNVVQSLESTTEKLLTRNTFLLVMSICIEKSKIHSKVRQVEMYVEIE